MLLQLNPTIWLRTPIGTGLAHFLIDYGEEHDLLWVVADDATGEIWAWPNPEVRLVPNISLGALRVNNVAKKYTEKQDEAYDRKRGIKEGSKRDQVLDKKRGLPPDRPAKKGSRRGK